MLDVLRRIHDLLAEFISLVPLNGAASAVLSIVVLAIIHLNFDFVASQRRYEFDSSLLLSKLSLSLYFFLLFLR